MITTVIPTFRRPKLLQKAIQSVLNQTYPHFQVCIYDNASGDETAAVVADIAGRDARVKYHCHPRNIGAIPNFNYGIKQVTTPYFSLLSDDNILLPHFFEDAIKTLDHRPEVIFFAGQSIDVNEMGQVESVTLERWPLSGTICPPEGLLYMWKYGAPGWDSVLFRKEAINSAGLLDSKAYRAADKDFMMKLARRHMFYTSKVPHAQFLRHSNSVTFNSDLIKEVSGIRNMLEHWLRDEGLSDEIKELIMKQCKDRIKDAIVSSLYNNGILGNDPAAIATAKKIMKKEIGLSYRPFRAILVAEVVNSNRFFKRIFPLIITLYLQAKAKIVLFKKKKKYVNLKT